MWYILWVGCLSTKMGNIFYFLWKNSRSELAIGESTIYTQSNIKTMKLSKNVQFLTNRSDNSQSDLTLRNRLKCARFSIEVEITLCQQAIFVCQRICTFISFSQNKERGNIFKLIQIISHSLQNCNQGWIVKMTLWV